MNAPDVSAGRCLSLHRDDMHARFVRLLENLVLDTKAYQYREMRAGTKLEISGFRLLLLLDAQPRSWARAAPALAPELASTSTSSIFPTTHTEAYAATAASKYDRTCIAPLVRLVYVAPPRIA